MSSTAKKDAENALKTIHNIQSTLNPILATLPKEYQDISASLTHPALQPSAPWGFLIFRTVYGKDSDAPWARMLKLLRSSIANTLSRSHRTDLLPRHELAVIEDEKMLKGANAHAVRHAFRAWVAEDLPPRLQDPELEKYGGSERVREKLASNDAHDAEHPVSCLPPRWNFCLFVDAACLSEMVVSGSAPVVVKILTSDWQEERIAVVAEGGEDGVTDEDWEEVGWMWMDGREYVDVYNRLDNAYNWGEFYERPAVRGG